MTPGSPGCPLGPMSPFDPGGPAAPLSPGQNIQVRHQLMGVRWALPQTLSPALLALAHNGEIIAAAAVTSSGTHPDLQSGSGTDTHL